MSVKLMTEVWASDISAPWQQILLALADRADDDGSSLHPSVSYLCWKTGKKKRQLRTIMTELREKKVLMVLRPAAQHFPPSYKLDLSQLPKKVPWEILREEMKKTRGAKIAPLKVADNPVDNSIQRGGLASPGGRFSVARGAVQTHRSEEIHHNDPKTRARGETVNKKSSEGKRGEPESIGSVLDRLATKIKTHSTAAR